MYKLLNGIDFYSAKEVDERFSEESIIAERERAQAAEQVLQDNIDTETTRATAAESENQAAIEAEVTRATAAEQTLQDNIAAETERAEATEQSLDTRMTDWETQLNQTNDNLTAETERAAAAEQTNADAITAEVTRATAAEQANLDAIAAEALRAQETERNINNALLSESNRAQAAETAIDAALSTEVTRATAAEQQITDNLTAEVTRATAAEQQIATDLSTEVTRATAAEQTNADAIAAEETRAQGAEQQIATDLSTEVTRATAAEQTNADAIAAEVTRATAAEQSLTQDIADEELRASQAEANLTSSITSLGTRVTRLNTEVTTNREHQIMTFDTAANMPSVAETTATQLKITDGQLAYVKDAQVWYKATVNSSVDPATVTWSVYNMSTATDKLEDYPNVVNPKPGQYRWLRFDPSNKNGLIIQKDVVINLSYFGVDATLHVNADMQFDMGTLTNGINYYVAMTYVNDEIILTAKTRAQVAASDIIVGRFYTLCASVGDNVTMITRVSKLTTTTVGSTKILVKAYTEKEDPDFFAFYQKTVTAIDTTTSNYNVATIEHPLTGYVAGNILPESIFCETFRPNAKYQSIRPADYEDAMVYDKDSDKAIDLYLQSGTGQGTVSIFGGTHTTSRTPLLHSADMSDVGKNLLTDWEFTCAAKGSNECTNIQGSTDKTTVGGHSDTAGRRMISAIGCEEMCGYLWQWLDELGPVGNNSEKWTSNADPSAKFGQSYGLPYVLLAGGPWDYGVPCGSLSRDAAALRSNVTGNIGARGSSRVLRGQA